MSKRHQSSRRRTYGRRQHELHERPERAVGILGWVDENDMPGPGDGYGAQAQNRAVTGEWLAVRGLD